MDWLQALWISTALVLILEGLLPLVSPLNWRRAMAAIAQLRDGQVRFLGLLAVAVGVVILLLV